jgi:hypothetical protein
MPLRLSLVFALQILTSLQELSLVLKLFDNDPSLQKFRMVIPIMKTRRMKEAGSNPCE